MGVAVSGNAANGGRLGDPNCSKRGVVACNNMGVGGRVNTAKRGRCWDPKGTRSKGDVVVCNNMGVEVGVKAAKRGKGGVPNLGWSQRETTTTR